MMRQGVEEGEEEGGVEGEVEEEDKGGEATRVQP